MPQGLLQANLRALSRHSPSAAKRLESVPPRGDLEVVDTASGHVTARIGGRALHSLYDPVREARRLVRGTVDDATTTCVSLGLGLGYHVEALLEAQPGLPVAVVEADLELLVAVLSARDLTGPLSSSDLRLYLGARPEEVASALEELPLGKTAILAPAALTAMDPEYYKRVEAAVRAAVDRTEINTNTLARFGRLWVRNLLRNAVAFVSSPGVSDLEGAFQDLPALVVAAGPTLDEVEPMLADLAGRAVVIAVDSSLGVCLRAGARPDLVVTVDPQYWNTRYFDRLSCPGAILVCEPSSHPTALRRPGLVPVFTSSLFPLGKLLEDAVGPKGRVGAGGSVATTAWDVARILGCRPIYLAGLDLGFPGHRTHARGLYFEELMVHRGTRTRPAETQSHGYLNDAGSLAAPATGGGTVVTDRRMQVYRWWFERQLARPSSPPTYTLSPHGLRIQGMSWVPPGELRRLPGCRDRIDASLSGVRSAGTDPTRRLQTRRTAAQVLLKLSAELDHLRAESERGLQATLALERELRRPRREAAAVARWSAVLDRVDRAITGTASRDVAGFLMQPLIHRIIGSRDSSSFATSARDLYLELRDSADLHVRLVQEALERLEEWSRL